MIQVWPLRPLFMFDTCVGFCNDGSIGRCPDGCIYHSGFDRKTKAFVGNECYDCSAFYGTAPGAMMSAECCQAAIGPHVLPIHMP